MNRYQITESLLEQFQTHLMQEEKSKHTVEKYMRDVRRFKNYLGKEEMTKKAGVSYKQYLSTLGYHVRSINSMIASLNCFFHFCDWWEFRLKSIRQQREMYCPEEKELTKEEYCRLIMTAKRQRKERLELVLQTICGTGIRVSELSYITVEAVKKGETMVCCKGKVRSILIIPQLKRKLLKYIKRHRIASGCIFITRTGKSLSRSNIWREMKRLCEEAEVNPKKVFPHNLRHLFARTFFAVEKDIVKLANILGHSNINTTRIYMVTTKAEHLKYMERMHLII